MTERKIEWDLYEIDDFKKSNAHIIRDELDPDEEDEEIEELDSAQTIYTTPMGIFVKDDNLNPLRTIEHWLCHTNFNIDIRVTSIVNAIEGVETLTVVTRYQMIIGFGKLFKSNEVRKKIEEKLLNMDKIPKLELNRLVQTTLQETFLGGK